MENTQKILLLAGVAVSILLMVLFNIFIGLIVLIILAVLVMSMGIMQDTADMPYVAVHLQDDAKGVVVRNRGNAPAYTIHITLVPLDIEFDIPKLEEEEASQFPLDKMEEELKAVVTFSNDKGEEFTKSYKMSALGEDDDDVLKPVFPLFKWK
ncbi:MAG TPA: hypothetical protein VMW63_09430 [Methanoregulaceae archaeon]|nr:hypothetical protein [Methanoregulaceae archaeon]